MPSSLESTMLRRIRGGGRGSVFTPAEFLTLGSRAAVDQSLSRLVKKGILRRTARGVYTYPEVSALIGELSPQPAIVAQALARQGAQRLLPAGAYAANQLGLTEQVSAKVEYLTDGRSRRVMIKRLPVTLRRTTVRNLATAGRITGTVIQAFRFLRRGKVSDEAVQTLRQRLTRQEKQQLLKDRPLAPAWMAPLFLRIAEDADRPQEVG